MSSYTSPMRITASPIAPASAFEIADAADAALLNVRREISIFMASIVRRRNRAAARSLQGTLCLECGCEPLISRQDAPSRYPIGRVGRRGALPRERFSPLAHLRHGAMPELSPLT